VAMAVGRRCSASGPAGTAERQCSASASDALRRAEAEVTGSGSGTAAVRARVVVAAGNTEWVAPRRCGYHGGVTRSAAGHPAAELCTGWSGVEWQRSGVVYCQGCRKRWPDECEGTPSFTPSVPAEVVVAVDREPPRLRHALLTTLEVRQC
jgi:hypothetical protein